MFRNVYSEYALRTTLSTAVVAYIMYDVLLE